MRWYLFKAGTGPPAFNMAMDEALLEAVQQLGAPVLRFYSWTQPAVTFGYFQKYTEVARTTNLQPLIRRPTGGGIVIHGSDWTYSLAFPANHPWYRLRAHQSYLQLHQWIQAAFALSGVQTELAPNALVVTPGCCFTGWEKADLLYNGFKIAGAAQRRTREGLLVQGSIQPRFDYPTRIDWEQAMLKTAIARFNIAWVKFVPDSSLVQRAHTLMETKYSLDSYNQKR